MANGPMPLDRAKPLMDVEYRTQLALEDYPTEVVNIACGACGRKGRLSKAGLIEKHGARKGLVDLINEMRPDDCPRNKVDVLSHSNGCQPYWRDLLDRLRAGPGE